MSSNLLATLEWLELASKLETDSLLFCKKMSLFLVFPRLQPSFCTWSYSIYILEWIRVIKTTCIFENFKDLISFLPCMICFQIRPNHAILSPINLDTIWFWYASIISLWSCPKIRSKQIFAIIYHLFDLIQF